MRSGVEGISMTVEDLIRRLSALILERPEVAKFAVTIDDLEWAGAHDVLSVDIDGKHIILRD